MKNHSVFARALQRTLLLSVGIAALASGCGEEDEPPFTPGFGPIVAADSGIPNNNNNTPTADAGGAVLVDAGGSVTADAGPVVGGGSVDTPWCKVKAIVDAKCVACHTNPPKFAAPFPLLKHEDFTAASAKVAGKKIYERIGVRIHASKSSAENPLQGTMPPGDELPADQRATIDAWIAAGAPVGDNPTCTPPAGVDAGAPPVKPETPWPPAECDGVYKFTANNGTKGQPYSVPPKQEIHPQVYYDAPWGNEEVQAIAFKTITDNTDVLHHWILYSAQGAFLTGWAPGEDGVRLMGPDIGMQMPTGTRSLRLDMHYNNMAGTGNEPDASGLEVCVVKKAKFRKNSAAVTMGLSQILLLSIPPNSTGHRVNASCTLSGTQPVTLLTASPHAHTYARRMIFTLKRKSGETITMLDKPFMFGDQKSFALDPPVVVQPGDTINTTCIYDNNTSKTVTFGEDTGNEMCFNFALYYPAGALKCGGFTLPF